MALATSPEWSHAAVEQMGRYTFPHPETGRVEVGVGGVLMAKKEDTSGGGAQIWSDRLQDLQSLYSDRLNKQWSLYCLTPPRPHVTERWSDL